MFIKEFFAENQTVSVLFLSMAFSIISNCFKRVSWYFLFFSKHSFTRFNLSFSSIFFFISSTSKKRNKWESSILKRERNVKKKLKLKKKKRMQFLMRPTFFFFVVVLLVLSTSLYFSNTVTSLQRGVEKQLEGINSDFTQIKAKNKETKTFVKRINETLESLLSDSKSTKITLQEHSELIKQMEEPSSKSREELRAHEKKLEVQRREIWENKDQVEEMIKKINKQNKEINLLKEEIEESRKDRQIMRKKLKNENGADSKKAEAVREVYHYFFLICEIPKVDPIYFFWQAISFAWENYKKYAWGKDELMPVLKSYKDWMGLGLTIFDSIDTLFIAGLMEEYYEAREFISTVEFEVDKFANVFELNIRVLGGLLSSFQLTRDRMFLNKAKQLGDILLKVEFYVLIISLKLRHFFFPLKGLEERHCLADDNVEPEDQRDKVCGVVRRASYSCRSGNPSDGVLYSLKADQEFELL